MYAKGKFPVAFVRVVTDGYIRAMGIPLRAGRDISERDIPSSEQVILINETMARTTVAVVAGYLHARRASRIDPMVALRNG